MIKWIFFDIGSTLIDESVCDEVRIQETLAQANAPSEEEFLERMKYYIKINQDAYKMAIADYNLTKGKWHSEYEKLYPNVKEVLTKLQTQFHLGVIANQSRGVTRKIKFLWYRSFLSFDRQFI